MVGKAEDGADGDKGEADKVHDFATVKDIREGADGPLEGQATEDGEAHGKRDLKEGEVVLFGIDRSETIEGADHHAGDDGTNKSDRCPPGYGAKRHNLRVVHFRRFVR